VWETRAGLTVLHMKYQVTVYCDHVSTSSGECTNILRIIVDDVDNIDDKIEERGWAIIEDGVLCEEHVTE